jgi:serine/threonine protein kinase
MEHGTPGVQQPGSWKRPASSPSNENPNGTQSKKPKNTENRAEPGLTEQQSNICQSWWTNSPSLDGLPNKIHLNALEVLTGASARSIEQWFANIFRQALLANDKHTELNRGSLNAVKPIVFKHAKIPEQVSAPVTVQGNRLPNRQYFDGPAFADADISMIKPKGSNCSEQRTNTALLSRNHDPNKKWQCTRGCGSVFTEKKNWKRHEEIKYPPKGFICLIGYLRENGACGFCGGQDPDGTHIREHIESHHSLAAPLVPADACGKIFGRGDHLGAHLKSKLHTLPQQFEFEKKTWSFIQTRFPTRCGFKNCSKQFGTWDDRINHISDHFVNEPEISMLDWDFDREGSRPTEICDIRLERTSSSGGPGRQIGSIVQSDSVSESVSEVVIGQQNAGQVRGSPCNPTPVQKSKPATSRTLKAKEKLQKKASSLPDVHTSRSQTGSQSEHTPVPQRASPSSISSVEHTSRGGSRCSSTNGRGTPTFQSEISANVPLNLQETTGQWHGSNLKILALRNSSRNALNSKSHSRLGSPSTTRGSNTSIRNVYDATTSNTSFVAENRGVINCISERKENENRSSPLHLQPKHVETDSGNPIGNSSTINKSRTRIADGFTFVKYLGSGAYSTVDEIFHYTTNLRLARKTVRISKRSVYQHLVSEAKSLRKLRHQHIIRLIGTFDQANRFSIFLSPVAESDLLGYLQVLNAGPSESQTHIRRFFGCLVSALRYIHDSSFTHGDIKPTNILISKGRIPQVLLCDFGACRPYPDAQPTFPVHRPLTWRYSAPEAIYSRKRGRRSDIFSLGCVFLEMGAVLWLEDAQRLHAFRTHFNKSKFYHEELLKICNWMEEMKGYAGPKDIPKITAISAMLSPNPTNRPFTRELSKTFPSNSCCVAFPSTGPLAMSSFESLFALSNIKYRLETIQFSLSPHTPPSSRLSKTHRAAQDRITDCLLEFSLERSRDRIEGSNVASLVQNWLSNCLSHHDDCVRGHPLDWVPSRLIDVVGAQDNAHKPRLVFPNRNSSSSFVYTALSYVCEYRSEKRFGLVASSLPAMANYIPVESLPEEIASAIEITKQLGQRYLWVDSLCIIQDSSQDVATQACDIDKIFRHAIVTLAIASPWIDSTLILQQHHTSYPKKQGFDSISPSLKSFQRRQPSAIPSSFGTRF